MRTFIFLLLGMSGALLWNKGGWFLYAMSPLVLCWPARKSPDES